MKHFNLFKRILFAIVLTCVFISCATSDKKEEHNVKAVLIEHPERMFWEIKKDNASIFILGTIHFADRNFFPLEERILEAFDSSGRLVSEIGGLKEMMSVPAQMQRKILDHINMEPEKNLQNFLSKEDAELLKTEFGEERANVLFMLDPWVLTVGVTELIYQKAGLNSAESIDLYLMTRAKDKKIEGLEDVASQLKILSLGTFEEQLDILNDTIEELKNPDKGINQIEKLKKSYLSNNRSEIEKMLMEMMSVPQKASNQSRRKFIDALLKDRNILWAEKFADYLNAGETVFVFAGAAHFLGEDSVFEQMRKNGILK